MQHEQPDTAPRSVTHALSAELSSLCERLDDCLLHIERSPLIQAQTQSFLLGQGAIYAAFLSDLLAERIQVAHGHRLGMLEAIEIFCDLITNELKTAA